MSSEYKTNVMRTLDKARISYTPHCYINTNATNAEEIAAVLGEDPQKVYKTLVTRGRSKNFYVFIIPATGKLNLKKAALESGEKSIEMIKSKELLPTTGYIHGGCSPISMKKKFPTFIDISALEKETVFVSAGKIGYQIEIAPQSLIDFAKITACELT